MKDSHKKVFKYGILAAALGGIAFFSYRVWKRMQAENKGTAESPADGPIIEAEIIPEGGEQAKGGERTTPGNRFHSTMDAATAEFQSWADSAKRTAEQDWFKRLISFDFFKKK